MGQRHFKVTVSERLTADGGPLFSAGYEEMIQLEVDGEWRALWVKANLPWETGDSAEECLQAALAQVNDA